MKLNLCSLACLVAVSALGCSVHSRHEARLDSPKEEAPGLTAAGMVPTERAISMFESRVAENPKDYLSRTMLGSLEARAARETGILSWYERAEATFRLALQDNPNHLSALTGLASALASQHRFVESQAIALRAVEIDPQRPDINAVLFDTQIELGQYDAAQVTLKRMITKDENPAVLVRQAQLAEFTGDNSAAVKFAVKALQLVKVSGAPDEELAWYHYRVGDLYAHGGDTVRGAEHMEQSLAILPNYFVALTALGHIREEEGNLTEAYEILSRSAENHPSPGIFFSLGEIQSARGVKDSAEEYFRKGEALAREPGIAKRVYKRELAKHLATRNRELDEALALIKADQEERQDIFGDAVLALVQYKRGNLPDADRAIKSALRTGIKEPEFLEFAELINQAESTLR